VCNFVRDNSEKETQTETTVLKELVPNFAAAAALEFAPNKLASAYNLKNNNNAFHTALSTFVTTNRCRSIFIRGPGNSKGFIVPYAKGNGISPKFIPEQEILDQLKAKLGADYQLDVYVLTCDCSGSAPANSKIVVKFCESAVVNPFFFEAEDKSSKAGWLLMPALDRSVQENRDFVDTHYGPISTSTGSMKGKPHAPASWANWAAVNGKGTIRLATIENGDVKRYNIVLNSGILLLQ